MGRLTTHVLDTAAGRPAAGVKIELYEAGAERRLLRTLETNSDGRCDSPLLEGAACKTGLYELVFSVGSYFQKTGVKLPDPPFLDQVVLRFGISRTEEDYHVPLLVSPWSFSTYRGS